MVVGDGSRLRRSLWLGVGREFLQAQLILPFVNAIELVGVEIAEGLFVAAKPGDFEQFDLPCGAQAEICAQVALGKIAAATCNFSNMRHSASDQTNACAHRVMIAGMAHEADVHEM